MFFFFLQLQASSGEAAFVTVHVTVAFLLNTCHELLRQTIARTDRRKKEPEKKVEMQ